MNEGRKLWSFLVRGWCMNTQRCRLTAVVCFGTDVILASTHAAFTRSRSYEVFFFRVLCRRGVRGVCQFKYPSPVTYRLCCLW